MQGYSLFYPLDLRCEKKTKNDNFHEGGKVGRTNATTIKLFSVDSYDLNTMSFKFGNDIFINFEMPGSFGKSTFYCHSVHLIQRSLAQLKKKMT